MKQKTTKKEEPLLEGSSDTNDEFEDTEEEMGESSEEDEELNENELDASDTESDEDVSGDDESPVSKTDLIRENLREKYKALQGKQLFILFPQKLPESEEELEEMAKKLSPLITKVHKPRQKHVRFCLVEFNSKDDRDTAWNELRQSIKNGDLPKCKVNIPRTENDEYIEQMVERKIKSVENKKSKNRLKKASKKAQFKKIFTPTVVIFNLPKSATLVQIRELFPNAVDIQMKAGKGKQNKDKTIASVTLHSTMEARNAVKQKLSMDGNQLVVKFDNQTIKKKAKKRGSKMVANEKSSDVPREEDEPAKKKSKNENNSEKKLENRKKVNISSKGQKKNKS
ncbi:nucleolin [Musca domestica]|uniref:Nucleolin n=1 Tax=Musca domestica TaxID=7370 RepID=A0A1I8NDA1_MUSDO|nr:nucleolin [Musca domestica]